MRSPSMNKRQTAAAPEPATLAELEAAYAEACAELDGAREQAEQQRLARLRHDLELLGVEVKLP